MSRLSPCKRREFIVRLKSIGFDGPFSGTRHQFMVYAQRRLTVPSNTEYSVPQLRMLLREVGEVMGREITIDEWNEL
jgi:hypothetical protein